MRSSWSPRSGSRVGRRPRSPATTACRPDGSTPLPRLSTVTVQRPRAEVPPTARRARPRSTRSSRTRSSRFARISPISASMRGAHTIAVHLERRHGVVAIPSVATIRGTLSAGVRDVAARKRPQSSFVRLEAQMPHERWQMDVVRRRPARGRARSQDPGRRVPDELALCIKARQAFGWGDCRFPHVPRIVRYR